MKILNKEKQTEVSKKLANVINGAFDNFTADAYTLICILDDIYDIAYIVGGISLMDETHDRVMQHLKSTEWMKQMTEENNEK